MPWHLYPRYEMESFTERDRMKIEISYIPATQLHKLKTLLQFLFPNASYTTSGTEALHGGTHRFLYIHANLSPTNSNLIYNLLTLHLNPKPDLEKEPHELIPKWKREAHFYQLLNSELSDQLQKAKSIIQEHLPDLSESQEFLKSTL